MARRSFGVKDVVGDIKEGTGGGNTPPPPAGVYTATVLKMQLSINKNGDDMITVIHKIEIPPEKKALAKHNGYWVFNRFNMTDQGAGFFNAFLNALAGSEAKGLALQKEVWENGTLTTDKELPENAGKGDRVDVTRIGKFNIGSPEGVRKVGIAVVERTYTSKKGTPEEEEVDTVDISRYMPAGAKSADGDDFADDGMDDGLDDSASAGEADDGLGDEDADGLSGDGEGGIAGGGDVPAADPDGDAFSAELDAIGTLKELRIKARDEYEIDAASTKGKTEDEVRDMIWDAWDAARAAAGDPDGLDDDLDDDLDAVEEKPKANRRGSAAKGGDGEPPF